MPPTAQRAGFVTGGRRLSGSASACAQTQAESAVTPGGPRCVVGTGTSRRKVHRAQQLFGSGRDASFLCHYLFLLTA